MTRTNVFRQDADDAIGADDCGRARPAHQLLSAVLEEEGPGGVLTTQLAPPAQHPGFRDLAEYSDPRYLMEATHQLYMVHLQRTARRSTQRPAVLQSLRTRSGTRLRPGVPLDARLAVTSRQGRSAEHDLAVVEVEQEGRPVGRTEINTLLMDIAQITARRTSRRTHLPAGPPCVGARPDTAPSAAAVGRARAQDVLLKTPPRPAADGFTADLLMPDGCGYFFDPPVDHVYGTAFVDAFLQLRAAAGRRARPHHVDMRFVAVCETDAPVRLTLEAGTGTEDRFRAEQGGDVAVTAKVS